MNRNYPAKLLTMPPALWRKLDAYARDHGLTRSGAVAELVKDRINSEPLTLTRAKRDRWGRVQGHVIRHQYLGVERSGPCAVCGKDTGDSPEQRALTCLYKEDDGAFCVVHLACSGGTLRPLRYHVLPRATLVLKAPDE